MKHQRLNAQFWILLLFFSFSLLSVSAQVTIGSFEKPAVGALLDLKEDGNLESNSTKGLGMPRVDLEKTKELLPCVEEALSPTEKMEYAGLWLYNTSTVFSEKLCPGLYVWQGDQWDRLYGSCEGFELIDVKDSYVMDGLSYNITLKTFSNWTATIDNLQGALSTYTIPTSGTEGQFSLAFTMAIKTDADAKASITIENELGHKEIITINGIKMTFTTSPNIVADVDGEVNNQATTELIYTSNSSRDFVITGVPSWATLQDKTLTVKPNDGDARDATIRISNGAMFKDVSINQEKLNFSVQFTQLGFFYQGSLLGFLQPNLTNNSKKRAVTVNANVNWLSTSISNGQPVVGATSQSLYSSTRSGNITIKLGETKSITVDVFQLGHQNYSFSYLRDGNLYTANEYTYHSYKTIIVCAVPYQGQPLEYVRAFVTGGSSMPSVTTSVVANGQVNASVAFDAVTVPGVINLVFRLKKLAGNPSVSNQEVVFKINQSVGGSDN